MSNIDILIEQTMISTNEYALDLLTEILPIALSKFLIIVLILYFGGLALSFLKNI